MTDYNAILDTETDPNRPLKSSLFKRIVANPIAVTEGAEDAPRIVGAAIKRLADMPNLSVSASDATSAELLCSSVDGILSTTNSSYDTARTITVQKATGSLRFRASHRISVSSNDSRLSITKNGVEVTSWTTNSTTSVERSVDIAVVPGDVVLWRHREEGTGLATTTVSGFAITASNGYVERPAYVTFLNKDTP